MRRVRLVLAYNGQSFHGFAINPNVATVAGTIGGALQQIFQAPIPLVSAGRTDAGVHATAQVISCDVDQDYDLPTLRKQLNSLCGPEIIVKDIAWAPSDFHARFSAIWRHYQYFVYNADFPDPFRVGSSWHVIAPLNLNAMQLACDPIIGTHDFSAFCRRSKPETEQDLQGSESPATAGETVHEKSLRRCVMQARWCEVGESMFRFDIRANAFCHQMVRALVGTFVEIGARKRPSSDMMALIRSGDRAEASQLAPPQGLFLTEVGYPSDVTDLFSKT